MDITHSGGSFNQHILQLQTANSGSGMTSFDYLNCHDSGSDKAWIRGDGTYGSATNSYGSTSDSKIKQDIVDARKDYWDDFKEVRFRKFRLKDQVAIDSDAPALLGVVAQEIESIFPAIVTESPDVDNTGPKPVNLDTTTKVVKYSILNQIGLCVIQELQTRLEAAETKIAALEAA